jgi:ribonuclease G
VGRKHLEDTILKTNLEACTEVVRQLRVRDIGGIVVIDFIDMSHRENREQVLGLLEAELAKDRTKTYVVELSPLGLVEMTRQNVTDGIRGIMTRRCPTCQGEGVVVSDETLAVQAERRLRRIAEEGTAEAFLVEVHPDVGRALVRDGGARLRELQAKTGTFFGIEGVDHLPPGDVRVSAEGTRELIERAALPVVAGEEREVTIEEVHTYDRRDGIARLDGGYVISVAGAADLVGKKVKVTIEQANRFCAYARLSE